MNLADIRLLSASNFSNKQWFHLSWQNLACIRILKCGGETHKLGALRLEEGEI